MRPARRDLHKLIIGFIEDKRAKFSRKNVDESLEP